MVKQSLESKVKNLEHLVATTKSDGDYVSVAEFNQLVREVAAILKELSTR